MDPQVLKEETNLSITRIGALYKDFNDHKQLNPEGYEANIHSWLTIFRILLTNDHFDQLSLPPMSQLISKLTLTTIGKPLSLETVINELVASKKIIPVAVFLGFETNIDNYITPNDSLLQIISPSYWIKQLNLVTANIIKVFTSDSQRYIVWHHLEDFTKRVLIEINQENDGLYSSKLYNIKLLKQLVNKVTQNFTDLDLMILIKHLTRDIGGFTMKRDDAGDDIVIKFDNSEVTDEDIGIAQLKWNIHEITKQLGTIHGRIENTKRRLKSYPVDKLKDKTIKVQILSLLNTKRIQEKSFANVSNTYDNLFELLNKMNEATSNINVFNVLKKSSLILNELNQTIDLDELSDVKDDIQQQIDQTNKASDILSDKFDEDIEEEYEALVKDMESQDSKESQELIDKLNNLKVIDTTVDNDKPVDNKNIDRERVALHN